MSSQGRLWSTAPSYRMLIYSGYCCRCWRCPGKDCRGAAKQRSPFWPRWTPFAFHGLSLGDRLRERYNGEWQQSVDPVYSEEFTY